MKGSRRIMATILPSCQRSTAQKMIAQVEQIDRRAWGTAHPSALGDAPRRPVDLLPPFFRSALDLDWSPE
jgi:hypothetical protein